MIKKILYTGILLLTLSSPVYGQMNQIPDCLNNESKVMIRDLEKMIQNKENSELIERYTRRVEMNALGYVLSNSQCGVFELEYLKKIVENYDTKNSTKSKLLDGINKSLDVLQVKDPVKN